MRKNKKLLLGGLSVLTLVAAGSGAVSTFAWFQAGEATATIGAATKSGTENITVTNPSVSDVSVAIPVDVAISGTGEVELAHYYGEDAIGPHTTRVGAAGAVSTGVTTNAAGLWTAYHTDTQAKSLVYNSTVNKGFGGGDLWKVFTVTITAKSASQTIDGVTYNQAEMRAKLAGRTAKVVFTSATRAKYLAYNEGTSSVTVADGKINEAGGAVFTIPLTNINVESKDYSAVGHFAVYVEGDRSGTVDESNPGAQAFSLAISDNAA